MVVTVNGREDSTDTYITNATSGPPHEYSSDTNQTEARCSITGGVFKSCPCYSSFHSWWHWKFYQLESILHRHHWKVIFSSLLLALLSLGLKFVVVDTDFESLWIAKNDRLVSEWQYLTTVYQRFGFHSISTDPHQYYYHPSVEGPNSRFPSVNGKVHPSASAASTFTSTTGLPGRDYMGTMEAVIQESRPRYQHNSHEHFTADSGILLPAALLDHLDFLVKVRRLQIVVGMSKWGFSDLCQRASLPFGAEAHPIQAYLNMITPCLIITPLDCFWEGSKVLGPEETTWIPWFGERTLLQWTNLDPIGLLENLKSLYGNHSRNEVDVLIQLFRDAGINHGYLNRSCLDPSDPACPTSSPNYQLQAPDVAHELRNGCPGFAANVLHWSPDLILGGRRLNDTNLGATEESNRTLLGANSIQSLILLRSPRDLYEAVRINDPYKHESWTVADAQHVLNEWRRGLRRLVAEHNAGIPPEGSWSFYVFTDNSLCELLRELTLRLGPVKLTGCAILVTLYSLVCLLNWRDPIRSQCWLALGGLLIILVSAIAGLGLCAALGFSFNVLTIQVLPFLLVGLGFHGVFTLSTCYRCCANRGFLTANVSQNSNPSLAPWPSAISLMTCMSTSTYSAHSESSSGQRFLPVLGEHGPALLFSSITVSSAFFCAAYIPIPLTRQFCLQAGTLTLIQSVCLIFIFPSLLKLDEIRRLQRRLDVLCCLKHPSVGDRPSTVPIHPYRIPPTEPPPPRSSSLGRSKIHQKRLPMDNHNQDTGAFKSCQSYPSIHVKVINHLPGGGGEPCCSSRIVSDSCSEHTVQTTVTVSGVRTSSSDARTASDIAMKGVKKSTYSQSHKSDRIVNPSRNTETPAPAKKKPADQAIPEDNFIPKTPILVRISRSLALMLTKHYAIQIFICLITLFCFAIIGTLSARYLRFGLEWTSLLPTDSTEHSFSRISNRDFGLYPFQIIARGTDLPISTQPFDSSSSYLNPPLYSDLVEGKGAIGFDVRSHRSSATLGRGIDFPMRQRQLHHLYHQISAMPGVVFAGRRYWLEVMRDWLHSVQQAFDLDRHRGLISNNGHWSSNASELGVLGLLLIVQTDRGPELNRIGTGRLVRNGIVDPPAFYTLLHAWRSFDALNFSSLACAIYPEPSILSVNWVHSSRRSGHPSDLLALPPTEVIELVLTGFYITGVHGTEEHLNLIRNIRAVTEHTTAQGVPVFPIGESFNFFENFLYLARETSIALGVFFAILLISCVVLFSSPVTSILLMVFGAGGGLCAALCGLCLLELHLNPISAVLLLLCSGLGARLSGGFLICWPSSHFTWSPSNHPRRQQQRTVYPQVDVESAKQSFLCKHTDSTATTSKSSSRSGTATPTAATNSSSNTSSIRSCLAVHTHARRHLIHALSNHFPTMFHSTVVLLLALAVIAASRVAFIVNYFFWLIVLVSLVCFCISVCVIPTVCFLFRPIQQLFVPVVSLSAATRLINPTDEDGCAVLSSGSNNSEPDDAKVSIESTTESESTQSSLITLAPSETTVSKLSHALKMRPRSADGGSLSKLSNMELLDLCKQQLRSFSDDYAAALVVAVATAATANSARSRPASLSTISEEPSHSSSTVSLNRPHQSSSTNSGSDRHDHSSSSNDTHTETSDELVTANLLRLIDDMQTQRTMNSDSAQPSTGATARKSRRWDRHKRTAATFDPSPPPSYKSVVHQMPSPCTLSSESVEFRRPALATSDSHSTDSTSKTTNFIPGSSREACITPQPVRTTSASMPFRQTRYSKHRSTNELRHTIDRMDD